MPEPVTGTGDKAESKTRIIPVLMHSTMHLRIFSLLLSANSTLLLSMGSEAITLLTSSYTQSILYLTVQFGEGTLLSRGKLPALGVGDDAAITYMPSV